MRDTPTTIASIATLLEPLTATVLAWWLLGEQLQPAGISGCGFLISAGSILYWENLRQQSEHTQDH